MKLLSIGSDRNLFQSASAVRARQIGYAAEREETHIVVFSLRQLGFEATQISGNGWIYPTNSSNRWFYIWDAIKLGGEIISRYQITHLTCQDPFLAGLVGWWLRRCAKTLELEIQVHTDIGSKYFAYCFGNKIRLSIARFVLPRADRIRVVSERIKQTLVREWGIGEEKITVQPIYVDLEKIRQAPITVGLRQKYPQFQKIVLMATRLEPEKDLPLALVTFSAVLKKLPQVGLIIVGSGGEEAGLKLLAQKLKLRSNVVFESWLDQATLYSYYKTADLFLSTSLYEGYGLAMVEAHAAGLEIVATDAGVAAELTAHLCPVGDRQCLAGKLLALLA